MYRQLAHQLLRDPTMTSQTTYKNTYKASAPVITQNIHLDTPPEEYDFNYCGEIKVLRSDRVELRPYVPSLHAKLLYENIKANPEVLRWLGTTPWETLQDVLEWSEKITRLPTDSLFYAIFTAPGSSASVPVEQYEFAGVLGLISNNPSTMMAEPGWILIMPKFQRTHVLTHTAGLMMHRILDPVSEGGMGYRRCQWTTTTLNEKSQAAAKRLGYKHDGVLRGFKILPPGKEACREGRQDSERSDWGVRDDWYASVMWYEWEGEGGVREHIDTLMARR